MFMVVLFTIAKIQKQPKCPSVDKWIKKLWYIYTKQYYAAVKKMKGFSEQRKSHRHRQQYDAYQQERGWGEVEEGKGGINREGRRHDLGW